MFIISSLSLPVGTKPAYLDLSPKVEYICRPPPLDVGPRTQLPVAHQQVLVLKPVLGVLLGVQLEQHLRQAFRPHALVEERPHHVHQLQVEPGTVGEQRREEVTVAVREQRQRGPLPPHKGVGGKHLLIRCRGYHRGPRCCCCCCCWRRWRCFWRHWWWQQRWWRRRRCRGRGQCWGRCRGGHDAKPKRLRRCARAGLQSRGVLAASMANVAPRDGKVVGVQIDDTAAKVLIAPAVRTYPTRRLAARANRHSCLPPAHIRQPHVDVTVVRRLGARNLEHPVDSWRVNGAQPLVIVLKERPEQRCRAASVLVAQLFGYRLEVNPHNAAVRGFRIPTIIKLGGVAATVAVAVVAELLRAPPPAICATRCCWANAAERREAAAAASVLRVTTSARLRISDSLLRPLTLRCPLSHPLLCGIALSAMGARPAWVDSARYPPATTIWLAEVTERHHATSPKTKRRIEGSSERGCAQRKACMSTFQDT